MCGEKQNSMCRHIYYSMLPSCYVVLWVFVGFMYRNFFSRVTCFYCQFFSLLAAAYKKNPFSCFIFVFIILFLLAVLLLFHDCLFDETCKMEHKFNVLQLFFFSAFDKCKIDTSDNAFYAREKSKYAKTEIRTETTECPTSYFVFLKIMVYTVHSYCTYQWRWQCSIFII